MNNNSHNQERRITLSIKEAAELTGLSVAYLYAMSASGELPVSKVGSRCLIFRDDLEKWLRSKRRGGNNR